MTTVAYFYYDPRLGQRPDVSVWDWTFDKVYEDIDSKRPQLLTLCQAAIESPPHTLVLRRLSELSDSLEGVADCLSTLESLGICVIAHEQGYRTEHTETPTATPDLLVLLEAVQQDQRSHKIRQGHAQNRLKGMPPPGKAPYGYRR